MFGSCSSLFVGLFVCFVICGHQIRSQTIAAPYFCDLHARLAELSCMLQELSHSQRSPHVCRAVCVQGWNGMIPTSFFLDCNPYFPATTFIRCFACLGLTIHMSMLRSFIWYVSNGQTFNSRSNFCKVFSKYGRKFQHWWSHQTETQTPEVPQKTKSLVRTLPNFPPPLSSPHPPPRECTHSSARCHSTGTQLIPACACWRVTALFRLYGAQCALLTS